MSKKERELMWVSPEFKKMLKIKTVQEGTTVIEYTRRLAKESKDLELSLLEREAKRKRESGFRFGL